jgi:transposase
MHKPTRFIGLDIHKDYFVACGVDRDQNQVFGPQRISWQQFEGWMHKHLTHQDAVVIEMTTNTWEVHDALLPNVHSVIVVHPPHVALIVSAQVKTDKKAALTLAQLHAAGLLPGIWVPPQEIRELRAMVAQRHKIARLGAIAKNRLHAVLHQHHFLPPSDCDLFDARTRSWWMALDVTSLEKVRITCDLDTLEFARKQKDILEECLAQEAAKDERIPLLIQLPGIGLLTAITILAAIGDITRFPDARKLVGYAGLGARVHDSGQMHVSGAITKTGRRDLRRAMADAANHAVQHHVHWKLEFDRLEPRLGRSKTIIAIAMKLLISVWHVLTRSVADCHADPRDVACSLFAHAYRVKVRNLPNGLSAKDFTRQQLDRLGIGQDLKMIPWGTKKVKLPPSQLPPASKQ